MGFNLATFLVQLLNLFILIWILKRFLYRPVLAIIDKRRQDIELKIRQAEEKLASANDIEQDLSKQKQSLEAQNQQYLDNLEKDISQQKKEMAQKLELTYQIKRNKLQEDLNAAWDRAKSSVNEMLAAEFVTLAQKVFAEWSEQTPMDQVLLLFQKKLASLPHTKHEDFQRTLLQQKILIINTSDKLSTKQQDFLKTLLARQFSLPAKLRIQFKEKAELILGIEMRLDTFSLDWSLQTYLEEVNQHIRQNITGLIAPAK